MADATWQVQPAAGEKPATVVYGESPIRVTGTQARFVDINQLCEEAAKIDAEVKSSGIQIADESGNERLLELMQQEHKDFAVSFPVPLRFIVQARAYNAHAFRSFVEYYQRSTRDSKSTGAVFATREKFLEVQAEYPVLLYKVTHPHADARKVREYRQNTIKQLTKEDKQFADIQKEVATQLEEADAEKRKKLYELCLEYAAKKKVATGQIA